MTILIEQLSVFLIGFMTIFLMPLMIISFFISLFIIITSCYKLSRFAKYSKVFKQEINSLFVKSRQTFIKSHDFPFLVQYTMILARDKFLIGKTDSLYGVLKSKEESKSFADDHQQQRQLLKATENLVLQKNLTSEPKAKALDEILGVKSGIDMLIQQIYNNIKVGYLQPNFETILAGCLRQNRELSHTLYWFPLHFSSFLIISFPAVFVMIGILGTFIGIQQGIPELSLLDPQNAEQTSQSLNAFFGSVSFAMNSSILGVLFAIILIIFGLIFNWIKTEGYPEYSIKEGLDQMWEQTNTLQNDQIPEN